MDKDAPLPRHEYDCAHCRYSWCCGPLCACVPGIAKAPPKRHAEVLRLQRNWRRRQRRKELARMTHKQMSSKGGKAGTGAAKARTSEQARAAVNARWKKAKRARSGNARQGVRKGSAVPWHSESGNMEHSNTPTQKT
jgi:hypothetical protein